LSVGSDSSGHTLRDLLARGHLRLVLLAVLLAAAGLTLSGIVVMQGYANANAELTARTVSYAVEPAVLFNDTEAVEATLTSLGDGSNVQSIEVLDASDNVLGRWAMPEGSYADRVGDSLGDFLIGSPRTIAIMFDGEQIGTVKVAGSSRGMLRYAMSGLVIAICCLALTVAATSMLARRLEREVLTPIEHVSKVAHAVRSDRAFGRRVEASGLAEIDQLGDDFNALLGELQGWHDSLTSENVALAHRAQHDALTGLGNREQFQTKLETAIAAARENNSTFCLMFIDIDEFKQINDTYGHEAGDAAICAVANRLSQAVGRDAQVFRLGGDEFGAVIDTGTVSNAADVCTNRITNHVGHPITLVAGQKHSFSVSIGIATFPEDGTTARELLRTADHRMYETKRGKRVHAQQSK